MVAASGTIAGESLTGAVDAVIIATPHFQHTTLGIAALEAGVHAMVEKPISSHKADAERLIAAQLPSDTKRPQSQFVIDNDGDRAQLERRARDVWLALEARAAAA